LIALLLVRTNTRDREANLTWVRRERVPRLAIVFYDKPGYTDMHLPSAFREELTRARERGIESVATIRTDKTLTKALNALFSSPLTRIPSGAVWSGI
jgi:hypothetical protein